MQLEGKLVGKNVYSYDPMIKATPEEVAADIKQFDSLALIRRVSDLGHQNFNRGGKLVFHGQVPVDDDFLMFAGRQVVEHGQRGGWEVSDQNLELLFRKLRFLYDLEVSKNISSPSEILLRVAYRGFAFQEKLLNSVARTILIYTRFWPNRKEMKANDIFQETLGLSFDQIFLHTFALIGSDLSYHFKMNQGTVDALNLELNSNLSLASENAYLAWCSRSFDELKQYSGSLDNVLEKYPLVDTQIVPEGATDQVYLVISKNCLYFKMTYYLYYDFIEKYAAEKGDNIFKATYGHVFQEYIGELLTRYFKKWHVIPEFTYQKGKDSVATVDWMIERNGCVVLFEIKQSSIFLNTKQTGAIDSFRNDCKTTILKAYKQLSRTEDDAKSKIYPELSVIQNAVKFEKVCVVADPLYFGNMLLPELGTELASMHVVNVTDLEDLLSLQKKSEGLFYLLEEKARDEKLRNMDFKEFNISKYKKKTKKHRVELLDEAFLSYMKQLGIGKDRLTQSST